MKKLQMYTYIEDEVCKHLDLFEKHFTGYTMYDVTSRPEIQFAPLSVDAGLCMYEWVEMNYVVGNIIFNDLMISPENIQNIIEFVVPHESGHWCTAVFNGYLDDEAQNINHGTVWKQMMWFFDACDHECFHGLVAEPTNGMEQWGCGCSIVNFDDYDKIKYSNDLYCNHCKEEYKPLKKREK